MKILAKVVLSSSGNRSIHNRLVIAAPSIVMVNLRGGSLVSEATSMTDSSLAMPSSDPKNPTATSSFDVMFDRRRTSTQRDDGLISSCYTSELLVGGNEDRGVLRV